MGGKNVTVSTIQKGNACEGIALDGRRVTTREHNRVLRDLDGLKSLFNHVATTN